MLLIDGNIHILIHIRTLLLSLRIQETMKFALIIGLTIIIASAVYVSGTGGESAVFLQDTAFSEFGCRQ